MEWLAQNDASLFSAWCEQLIRAEAPLLRRLAIHGMIEYAALSWDDKVALATRQSRVTCLCITSRDLPARAMRLSVCARRYAPATH